MLLLLPSLLREAFYKVFIRGRVRWDFGSEKLEPGRGKASRVRRLEAEGGSRAGRSRNKKTTPANDASTSLFRFFLPATTGHEKNLHGGCVQAPFSQTEPLFRAPDVYLRAAIKQWLFAGLARAGSRTASSLWENTLPHRLSPPHPLPPPEHFISLPMVEGKAPPPPHSRRDCRRRGSAARSIIL